MDLTPKFELLEATILYHEHLIEFLWNDLAFALDPTLNLEKSMCKKWNLTMVEFNQSYNFLKAIRWRLHQ